MIFIIIVDRYMQTYIQLATDLQNSQPLLLHKTAMNVFTKMHTDIMTQNEWEESEWRYLWQSNPTQCASKTTTNVHSHQFSLLCPVTVQFFCSVFQFLNPLLKSSSDLPTLHYLHTVNQLAVSWIDIRTHTISSMHSANSRKSKTHCIIWWLGIQKGQVNRLTN